jgi:putative ABC transport system permease protein
VRNAVAPSYFSAMTLSFARGATFESGEPNTVILSESAARVVFPNQDPIGKNWNYQGANRTVVGVVKDSGANLLIDPDSIEAYIPLEGANLTAGVLILHTRSDPAPLLRLIPSAASAVDLTVSESLVRSSRDNYLQDQRGVTALIASIGAVAATLAAAGMFALVAFTVAQRRREFGIRIAIGARPHHVLNLLLAQNATPVIVGTLAGAILAVGASRVVRGVITLQDSQTIDPLGFAAGIAVFLVIAAFAALSPALRALKIDPSATLRE